MIDKYVKNNSPSPTSPIRDVLKEKDFMRTVQHYLCDHCDHLITNHLQGFVIHGNIYVADPNCRGGMIGNNFPEVVPGDKIEVTDVKETVLCANCLKKALNLDHVSIPRKNLNQCIKRPKPHKISDR